MKNISDENIKNEEKIMESALELFTQKGYEAVGVQEICQLANITKPTLYYYFGSKEGVFNRIIEINFAKFNLMLDEICVYTPKPDSYYEDIYPVLLNITLRFFNFAKENPKFYSMILGSVFSYGLSPSIQRLSGMLDYQRGKMEDLFKSFSNVHTSMKNKEYILSTTFTGMINAFIYHWYREGIVLDRALGEKLVHQYMHGIHS